MHLASIRPNEKIIHRVRVSAAYVGFVITIGLIFLLIAVFTYFFVKTKADSLGIFSDFIVILAALVPAGIGLYMIGFASWFYNSYHYYLTNQRVIETKGLFSKRTSSIDYRSVTDILVTQDPIERFFFQVGTVELNTAGGPSKEVVIFHVSEPYTVQEKIRELAEQVINSSIKS